MNTYISLGRWTADGVGFMRKWDGDSQLSNMMAKFGVEVIGHYWVAIGALYDMVVIYRAEPDALLAARDWTLSQGRMNTNVLQVSPIYEQGFEADRSLIMSMGRFTPEGMQSPRDELDVEHHLKAARGHGVDLCAVYRIISGKGDLITFAYSEDDVGLGRDVLRTITEGRLRTDKFLLRPMHELAKASALAQAA